MSRFWKRQSQDHLENEPSRDEKVSELRAALGPLSGRSLLYCTDACLRRYLEARNWNVDKAKKMMEETLVWRSTYKPEEIRWHEVAQVSQDGLVSIADFHDRFGRTVLIMRPGVQKTKADEGNLRNLVYIVENALLNLPQGQEQMTWLIDFSEWSLNTNIPIKVAQDIGFVLQNHYPEILDIVILYNPPRIFEAFWKVIKYFADAKTREKNKFVYPKHKGSEELMRLYFDADNLPSQFGGKATLKYDHEEFSRLMALEDVKTAKYWGFDGKPDDVPPDGCSGAEVITPGPVSLAVTATAMAS